MEEKRKLSREFDSFKENFNTKGITCKIPVRYIVTFMGCWGFMNLYAMRVNLSVAIVEMVNSSSVVSIINTSETECKELQSTSTVKIRHLGGVYNWDSETQALILGSFFYGYVITQIPGGYFAEKFGAKWLFGLGVLVTAVFSLLTPLAADWGVAAFLTVRILEGLGEGVTMPAMNALISKWAPKYERSLLTTIIYTGCQMGNVVAMPISGVLCGSQLFGGWPSVFYVFGAVGCLWFILWIFLVHETPDQHPSISKEELHYINKDRDQHGSYKPPVPWKSIFTSVPLWALVITHFGHSWGFLMLLTELPSYLSNILHFNIKDDGALSALPYLVQFISAWIASYVADRIRRSGRLRITTIRKIFNTIGVFAPAVCLIGVTMSGCRPLLIVSLISLALAMNGLTYAGFNVTHVDMSPDFAGTVYGITNTVANLCGILGPAVVGKITASGNTIANWSIVFYITAAVYIVTGIVFILFASAELQPWGVAPAPVTKAEQKKKESQASIQMDHVLNAMNNQPIKSMSSIS